MVIQGGLDYSNQILHDLWLFDLVKQEWQEIKIKLPLIKHTITPIFDNDRKLENVLHDLRFKEDVDFKTIIQNEGLYVF